MGRWGHMTGAQPLYTFQNFLNDLKLLNIVSNKTWGMLNFSHLLKHICLCQVSMSLLGEQIDQSQWSDNEIGHDMGQSACLFITLPTQAGDKCHYGIAVVWCHPSQSNVNINTAFRNTRTTYWVMDCSQCWCRYSTMLPSGFSKIQPL